MVAATVGRIGLDNELDCRCIVRLCNYYPRPLFCYHLVHFGSVSLVRCSEHSDDFASDDEIEAVVVAEVAVAVVVVAAASALKLRENAPIDRRNDVQIFSRGKFSLRIFE